MTNRPQAAFLFLVACALAPLVHAQSVVRGPYLQSGTPSGVTVRWRTNVATDSVVRFGTTLGNLDSTASNSSTTTEHGVEVDGLLPDTRYFYSVGTSSVALAGNDNDHTFVTSPLPGDPKPTRIWVIGDSGTANDNARAVRNAFLDHTGARDPDLWLMLGDNAYPDGTDAEYQAAVFDMYPGILRKSVLWPTLGNHDGHTADSAGQSGPYYDIFELPTNGEAGGVPSGTEAYYSFDYGDLHVICLDSDQGDTSPNSGMMTWLLADLLNNDKHWLLAFWHHPPYSKGSHDSDSSSSLSDMREDVLPILEDHGVDLVLSGHSHSYERSYLIDGHYGESSTFTAAHKKDPGDGSEAGDGAYQKPFMASVRHEGAVYTVAGSSGKTSGGKLNHPAMVISLERLGSVVLDIDGVRMDARFLDDADNILDDFTILKGDDITPPSVTSVAAATATEVVVSFSERVESSSAVNTNNYDIDNGAAVTGAVLAGDGLTVTLTTTVLTSGTFLLTVNNVSDLAGNVIVDSQTPFDYVAGDSEPPSPPGALTVLSTSETEVGLGWEASTDDTGIAEYAVYRDGNEAWTTAATSFTATGLTPDTSYEFWVTARDVIGKESEPSNVVTATTDTPPDTESPSRPGTPTLDSKTDTTVTFSWTAADDNVGVVAYDVLENGSVLVSTGGSTLTYTRTGLVPETTYSYTITAWDAAGNESLPSDPLSVMTDPAPDTEPPTPPDTLTSTNTDTTITLTWDGATDNVGVVGYDVHANGAMIGSTSEPIRTFIHTGLTPETTYSYVVFARDAAGNVSVPSDPLNVTTDPSPQLPMQVSIFLELRQFGKWQTGRALVSVADEMGDPIDGATVTAQWSGLAADTDSGTTTGGTVQLESDKVSDTATGQFRITVTAVTAPGYLFDPALSAQTACIDTQGQTCELSPPDTPISMSVDIEVTLLQQGKNTTATADVMVTDQDGPLSDVIVEGGWSLNGEGMGSASGLTNSGGMASIDSPRLKASTGDVFRFTVTRLIFDGYVYTVNDKAESTVP